MFASGIVSSRTPAPPRSPISPTISATPAAYAEAMWEHKAWTIVASARMDWFQNYDGHETQWNGSTWVPTAAQPPQRDERIFDPRLGISRKLSTTGRSRPQAFAPSARPRPASSTAPRRSATSSRCPTAACSASAPRDGKRASPPSAHGAASAPAISSPRSIGPSSPSPPVPTCSPILLMRENLGQIESRGVSLDFDLASPLAGSHVDGGYQYAHAAGTSRGTQDLGNWIPEVARNLATLNLRASRPSIGTISLQSRLSGRQFDDDANAFLLHGYFRLDAYASHNFGKRLELFAAGENLFDRSIEVSKTPTTTLGQPRTARAGFLIHLGRTGE